MSHNPYFSGKPFAIEEQGHTVGYRVKPHHYFSGNPFAIRIETHDDLVQVMSQSLF